MIYKKFLPYVWLLTVILIFLLSYCFVDANLQLSGSTLYKQLVEPGRLIFHSHRYTITVLYFLLLTTLFLLWVGSMRFIDTQRSFPKKKILFFLFSMYLFLLLSYPFLSYDIFNYITTAKVAYTWHENPYIVMPVEIPNEPYLAFTRAANKVALYGPVWILLTYIPHVFGFGQIWETIIAFKCVNILWYFSLCFLIYRVTKSRLNVIFFALNPLILLETVVSGHNDIVMMFLSCFGLLLWQDKTITNRLLGIIVLITSILIKGATIVLLPLLLIPKVSKETIFFIASIVLFVLFVIVTPIREELYPWYAVWFLSTVAFLPYSKYHYLWKFCVVISIGLELRHIPYMAMGYYEGPGPILRLILTLIPIAIYSIWVFRKEKLFGKFVKLFRHK